MSGFCCLIDYLSRIEDFSAKAERSQARWGSAVQTTQRLGLSLMLLGDFETGFWARSAVTALATRRQPHLTGDCGVWHGMASLAN